MTSPQPITTELRHLSPETRRECAAVSQTRISRINAMLQVASVLLVTDKGTGWKEPTTGDIRMPGYTLRTRGKFATRTAYMFEPTACEVEEYYRRTDSHKSCSRDCYERLEARGAWTGD